MKKKNGIDITTTTIANTIIKNKRPDGPQNKKKKTKNSNVSWLKNNNE